MLHCHTETLHYDWQEHNSLVAAAIWCPTLDDAVGDEAGAQMLHHPLQQAFRQQWENDWYFAVLQYFASLTRWPQLQESRLETA